MRNIRIWGARESWIVWMHITLIFIPDRPSEENRTVVSQIHNKQETNETTNGVTLK